MKRLQEILHPKINTILIESKIIVKKTKIYVKRKQEKICFMVRTEEIKHNTPEYVRLTKQFSLFFQMNGWSFHKIDEMKRLEMVYPAESEWESESVEEEEEEEEEENDEDWSKSESESESESEEDEDEEEEEKEEERKKFGLYKRRGIWKKFCFLFLFPDAN